MTPGDCQLGTGACNDNLLGDSVCVCRGTAEAGANVIDELDGCALELVEDKLCVITAMRTESFSTT